MTRFRVPECKHTARGACTHVACRYHLAGARDDCALAEIATRGPLTLERVGELLGVCRERARQIEAKALARLTRNVAPDVRAPLVEALCYLDAHRGQAEPPEIEDGDLPDLSDRDARKPWIRREK